jgi:two-component system, cell cycle response regulator DivK
MAARILVVEDDAASRELLRYLFDTTGYTVLVAADGATGAWMALKEDPDLILCDLQMPLMDGYAVLRQLNHEPGWRRVPVIAVTAFSMEGDREAALKAGFDGYFSKPVTPETIVPEIEAFLPAALRAPGRADRS